MRRFAPLIVALSCYSAYGQASRPSFPEGLDVSRALTRPEIAWLREHPFAGADVESAPPTGVVHCAAEYEQAEGILMSWEGTTGQTAILTAMAKEITTRPESWGARVFMVVDTAAEQSSVSSALSSAGVDMNRVSFVVAPTDTIWIRDYGPRYIYQGGCRAIIDHIYNRPRPLDDAFPTSFANFKKHGIYQMDLVHGGGNFHLDSLNLGYATRLVNNENSSLSESSILTKWRNFQNLKVTLLTPFPTTVDSTQHLDMWMQIIGDHNVVISDWPLQPGSTQDVICDNAAAMMLLRGYQVSRTPAISSGGTHFTYTNVVYCNGMILIPRYTQSAASPYNATALSVWQAANPGKLVLQIDATNIVGSAGVLHCIVMHVPINKNGEFPEAYVQAPYTKTSMQFSPGQQVNIRWLGDDDVGIAAVDIFAEFGNGSLAAIAQGLENTGSYTWNVPSGFASGQFRILVKVRDASNNVAKARATGLFHVD